MLHVTKFPLQNASGHTDMDDGHTDMNDKNLAASKMFWEILKHNDLILHAWLASLVEFFWRRSMINTNDFPINDFDHLEICVPL